MMDAQARHVAGLQPWLPWPLSTWPWWTQPVRAEALAALRIAVSGCLLIDMLTSYWPRLDDFFGLGGLGGSQMFAYYGEAPKLHWSLLRGVGDPLLGMLALFLWIGLTGWLVLILARMLRVRTTARGACLLLWLAVTAFLVLGAWTRGAKEAANGSFRLLQSWQDEPILLTGAFWAWAAAAVLLLAGCWTRPAAIAVWALSLSFANVNPYIDNAGDTVRNIILYYLMLCPCGAVWSVDQLRQSWHEGTSGPVYVWPWPLRLLFVQLVFIYFTNGLYKVTGGNWLAGDSLYYVLCDLTLTRFSIAQLRVPFVVTQVATWLVLAWELSFPLLVIFRHTRRLALCFGVAFHLGILATMELGGFVPYVLCLYVPLLPWEKMLTPKAQSAQR